MIHRGTCIRPINNSYLPFAPNCFFKKMDMYNKRIRTSEKTYTPVVSSEILLRETFTFVLDDRELFNFEARQKTAVTLLAQGKGQQQKNYYVTFYGSKDLYIVNEINDYAATINNFAKESSNHNFLCWMGNSQLCGQKKVLDLDVLLPADFVLVGELMVHIVQVRSNFFQYSKWNEALQRDRIHTNLTVVGKEDFYGFSGKMFIGPYVLKKMP